jgi:hypothetical protein
VVEVSEPRPAATTTLDTAIPAKRIRRLVSVQRDAELEDAMRRLRQLGTHVARTVDEDRATTGGGSTREGGREVTRFG